MRFDRRLATVGVLACSVAFPLLGCGSAAGTPAVSPNPSISIDELQAAPERLLVGGRDYALQTQLWRDFMPVSPSDGKPLVAFIQVLEQNGQPIAPDLKLEYLWVINGSEIWATPFSDEETASPRQGELNAIARNGPKWGPQIQVDVVVGMRRGGGPLEYLKAADQWIVRTD